MDSFYTTYSITDPNERACMEIQIMEFGQVPKQLFKAPHPARFGAKVSPSKLLVDGHAQSAWDSRKNTSKKN